MSFDLSSTTSSDEASVVDISALLPDKTNTDEKKAASSLLLDSSSSSTSHDNEDEDNAKHRNYAPNTETISDLKKKKTIGASIAKGSLKRTFVEDTTNRTIRVVMGESVKNLQRKGNPHRSTNNPSKAKPMNNEEVQQQAHPPTYVIVQQRDAPSGPNKAIENETWQTIDFEKSRLDVQPSTSGKNDRVHIVEKSPTSEKKEIRYTAKTCKRQFSKNGNQTTTPTSSVFVDCIAIWDAERQVYKLEIPELIASDMRLMPSPDDDKNPFEQPRENESRLFNNRKRRHS